MWSSGSSSLGNSTSTEVLIGVIGGVGEYFGEVEQLPRWCSILRGRSVRVDRWLGVGWGAAVEICSATLRNYVVVGGAVCDLVQTGSSSGGVVAGLRSVTACWDTRSITPLSGNFKPPWCLPACSVTTSDLEFEIPSNELQIWAPAAVIPPTRCSLVFLHLRRPAILRLRLLPTRCSRSPSASGLHRHSQESPLPALVY